MPELWDAFIQDYGNEIFDWPLRRILKLFWYYCQDGCKAVEKYQQEGIKQVKEE